MEVKDFLDRIETIKLKEDEYLVFRFPSENHNLDEVNFYFEKINESFKNTAGITAFPDDCSLDIFSKEEVHNWLMHMLDFFDANKKWEKVTGIFTPGGDPCYICPSCHDEDSRHINGIECLKQWKFCPCCGERLDYY